MKTFLRIFFIGVALLVVAIVGLGYFLRSQVTAAKKQLVLSVEKNLGARAEVGSLRFDWRHEQIVASGILLTNERPEAPWDRGQISFAIAKFKWRDCLSTPIPLQVKVSSWKLILCSRASVASRPEQEDVSEAATPSAHSIFQVANLSADSGEVEVDLSDASEVMIHTVAFDSTNDSGTWTTDLKVGSVSAGTLLTGPGAVRITGMSDKIAFSGLHLQCAPGAIDGEGDVSLLGDHPVQISLKAVQVPVAMLLATQWRMKLSGLAVASLDYRSTDQGASAHGHVELTQGRFNLLLFLSKVTTLLDLPDLSGVDLDVATSDFDWKDHVFQLTHLDLRKNGVARILGDVKIDAAGQIDGSLKLGLPSATLAKWPSLQGQVFPIALEDYNWAQVHLTGTPDHLEEDLTPRLLAAGAQQSGTMLNDAVKKAGDLLDNFLPK